MKKKLRVLLSILGVSTLAVMGAGCSTGDSIKTGIDQLFCKHEYSEFTVTKDATCYEEGEQERTCGKCGKVDKEEILTLDHTPTVLFGGKDATCTEVGYFPGVKCAVEDCGAVIQEPEEIPAHGHTPYTIESKAVSCFEDGYTEGVGCRVCNEVIEGCEVIQAPNAHAWKEVGMIAPTCLEEGKSGGSVCVGCGEVVNSTTLPVIDHTFENGACTVCGSSENLSRHVLAGYTTQSINADDSALGRVYKVAKDKEFAINGHRVSSTNFITSWSYKVRNGKIVFADESEHDILSYFYKDGYYYVQMPDTALSVNYEPYGGYYELFAGGNYTVFADSDVVEVIFAEDKIQAIASTGEYNNVLVTQENGLQSYTYAGVGDYVRGGAVTLAKGEVLACDFTLAAGSLAENGWFGVVFGDGTDCTSYPGSNFGMRYYDMTACRYSVDGSVVTYDGEKKLSAIIPVDGSTYNYRIKLTYNYDGSYSYQLLRKVASSNVYTVIDEYLNFACPTPSSLMLTALNNPFTLTDLVFYKAV